MGTERFGLGCAVATPVTAEGAVDLPRLSAHLAWLRARGVAIATLFGTTGEGASFGLSERRRALEAARAAGYAPRETMVGVAAANAEDAIAQARQAIEADCRGLLLAPPFYFHGAAESGVEAWFARVLAALPPTEVILYHIPSMTGVGLSPALIGRLRAGFPRHVAGVKDSSSNRANTDALLAEHRDLLVLVGDERDLGHAVRNGGSGTICGMANVIPERLVKVAVRGEEEPVLAPLIAAVAEQGSFIPAMKALIGELKGDPGWALTAPPLSPIARDAAAAMGAKVARLLG